MWAEWGGRKGSGVAIADVADESGEDVLVVRSREPGGEPVEGFLSLMQIRIGYAARPVVEAVVPDGVDDAPDVFVGKDCAANWAKKVSRSAGASESA